MSYRLYLKCQVCGNQSIPKDYDKSKEEMRPIIQVCQRALRLPQYLICPKCLGIMSVKPVVIKIN